MAAPSQLVGQILGHYRILEQIGAGGMGVVYRAHDVPLDRDIALKVLPSGALADEAASKRFRKEALALSRLNHPNIAMVFDFDTQDWHGFPGGRVHSRYNSPTIYAGLGDKNRAFEFLEKAYRERSSDLPYFLKFDLRIDNLRSDPRFQDLVRRVGLP